MRKLNLTLLLFFLFSGIGFSQNPVKWSYQAEKVANGEYDIVLKAAIEDHWCIYSQYLAGNDGPVPTSIQFETNTNVEFLGKIEEDPTHRKEINDAVFAMKLIKFYDEAIFKQRIKVKGNVKNVSGIVTYMSCDNTMCLPPKDLRFNVTLP